MHDRRRRSESREYVDTNSVTWTFTPRPQVRHSEETTHLVLYLESAWETRIGRCPVDEWESDEPDFARILAESNPLGGSRALGSHDRPPEPPSGKAF